MGRFKVLMRNTSTGDRIKLGLLGLVFLVMAVISISRSEARLLLAVVGVGFVLPWLFRDLIVERARAVGAALNVVAYALAGLALLGNVVRSAIPKESEMLFAGVIFAVLALYLGCYFWMLSDERIVRL